jgi:DNA-binding NarL/FixJ family response regulator
MPSETANVPTRAPIVIKVGVIEDQRDIRDGLQILINGSGGYHCSGAYRSIEEALARIANEKPDVLLLDIGLPGISGIEGIPLLQEKCPQAVLVILTVYDDDERIFEAICAGASGYLLKKTPPSRLLESLTEAYNGGAPMSPEVARRVITLFREVRPSPQSVHDLTPHELRLLKLLAEGHNYKTAAVEFGVSVNTISFHVKHIYAKLHVHSKSEAVAEALRRRIIQ